MKMHSGFTLVEVLIALAILSGTIFTFSELQMRSMIRVFYGREEIDRLYMIKQYAYRMYLEPKKAKKSRKQTIEEPEMTIQLQMDEIHKKSSLAPYKKQLQIIRSEGSWRRSNTRIKRLPIISVVRMYEEPQQ